MNVINPMFHSVYFRNVKKSTLSNSLSLKYLIALFIIPLSFQLSFAQKTYQISPTSKMFIHGTSSLHDWTSEVEDITGTAEVEKNGFLKDLQSLKFKAKVESIESGKSKMNSLTYEALKSENHPYITFQLDDIKSIQSDLITAAGKVIIAGVTKNIIVKGKYSQNGNQLKISGKHDIKMTEFNIKPPTAMFGTIVVGEDVTIEFNLILTN